MYISLQKRDVDLLNLLAKDFLLLTREQIQQLISTHVRRTNQRLAKLVKYKLLERREPKDKLSPNMIFYYLGEKAARHLHGYDPAYIRDRRARAKDFGDSFLRHLHLINAVQIKFRTCKADGYHFHGWTPYDNTNWDDKSALGLRPDGYVRFTVNGEYFCNFVEIDLATERGAAIRKKIERYQAFDSTDGFWQEFKQDSFRVLFVTNDAIRSAALLKLFPTSIFWTTTATEMLSKPLFDACWMSKAGQCALNLGPDQKQLDRARKRKEMKVRASVPSPKPEIVIQAKSPAAKTNAKMMRTSEFLRLHWLKFIIGIGAGVISTLYTLAIRHARSLPVSTFSSPEPRIYASSSFDPSGLVNVMVVLGFGIILFLIFSR